MSNKPSSPNKPHSLHGVFIDVCDLGVLILGESGIGKSELALCLITQGHKLIADDAVLFSKDETGQLIGRSDQLLQDFLEVRGLGILDIRKMYGDEAIIASKQLDLIIEMIDADQHQKTTCRLFGADQAESLLGVDVAKISLPVAAGRNLAVLVEAAVRNQLLKLDGYNASKTFIARHKAKLNQGNS